MRFFCSLSSLFICCVFYGQESARDSLVSSLESKEGAERVNLLNEIYFSSSHPEDSIYILEAIHLSDSINYTEGLLRSIKLASEKQSISKAKKLTDRIERLRIRIWIQGLTLLLVVIGIAVWLRSRKYVDVASGKKRFTESNKVLKSSLEKEQDKLTLIQAQLTEKEKRIEKVKDALKSELSSFEKQKLVKEIDDLVSNKKNIQEFDKFFATRDITFIDVLKKRHPNLSQHELRICSFLNTGMNNREIAKILNIQPNSVNIARYRIKNKCKVGRGTFLDYLKSITQ